MPEPRGVQTGNPPAGQREGSGWGRGEGRRGALPSGRGEGAPAAHTDLAARRPALLALGQPSVLGGWVEKRASGGSGAEF